MRIIDVIKQAMTRRKVKATTMARDLGIPDATLSLFLNEKREFGYKQVEKIFIYLNIKVTCDE